MKFVTVRELRSKTSALRKDLATEREIVLTANGRPFGLISPLRPETFEEDLRAIRLARFGAVVERIQARSKAMGMDKMTMEEIDALIAQVRRERRLRKKGDQ